MEYQFSPEYVIRLLKNKFFMIALPALALASLLILIIALLPAKYESGGKLMVRTEQLSLTRNTQDKRPVERFRVVQEQVMTRPLILEIVQEHNVFADQKLSNTAKVDLLRENIFVKTVRDDRIDMGTDDIAFTIGYRHPDSEISYRVANSLVNKFLEKATELEQERTQNNSDFFQRQVNSTERELIKVEADIANIRSLNAASLPEDRSVKMQSLERAQSDISRIDSEIAALNQELGILQSERGETSQRFSDEDRLSELRQRRDVLLSQYTDRHPEVKSINAQIAGLEAQLDPSSFIANTNRDLSRIEQAIQQAEAEGASTDQLNSLKGERASLRQAKIAAERALQENRANDRISSGSARKTVVISRIESMNTQRASLVEKITSLESQLAKTASVALQLSSKEREKETLENKLDGLEVSLTQAGMQESLVRDNRGPTFQLLESAVEPEVPTSPDRVRLSFLGVFLSGFLALVIALAPEMIMPKIRSKNQLQEFVPIEDVVTVPQYHKKETRLNRNSMLAMKVGAMIALGVILVGLLAFTLVR